MSENVYNKKTIHAWVFYDWANSVYSLVISTAIFPIYYNNVTIAPDGSDVVRFLGMSFPNTALYSYALSFSFLLVVILSPVLSGIADYSSRKLTFLKRFCYIGATSVAMLFFFTGRENIWIGIVFTILASVGFWGSAVFYNSFLPEIAPKKYQDKISAKGFSMGYFGSSLLLILMLVFIQKHEWFGVPDSGMATRISFILVAVWWAGFAQITFRGLPKSAARKPIGFSNVVDGYNRIIDVWKKLKTMPVLRRFLVAFFLLSTGVQTVILLATPFGTKALKLGAAEMVITILLIQFVAIAGATLFAWISSRKGNFFALKVALVLWMLVAITAWSLGPDDPLVRYKFFALGGFVGLVLGGIQSIARSTYSKMLPKKDNHTTFFSFYDVTEKFAIVVGTFSFGFIEEITGSMNNSALLLSVFFLLSLILISTLKFDFNK